jgi:hypothetical protein
VPSNWRMKPSLRALAKRMVRPTSSSHTYSSGVEGGGRVWVWVWPVGVCQRSTGDADQGGVCETAD